MLTVLKLVDNIPWIKQGGAIGLEIAPNSAFCHRDDYLYTCLVPSLLGRCQRPSSVNLNGDMSDDFVILGTLKTVFQYISPDPWQYQ